MKQELKTAWISALRSGKYRQGERTMNEEGKMCCLGVLCDVARLTWTLVDEGKQAFACEAGRSCLEKQEERKKLDISDKIHEICYSMNDGRFRRRDFEDFPELENRKYSFSEIADFLEKNL